MKPRHLYVHAPFCARRCNYCDFAVTVAADPPVSAWVEALGRELDGMAAARGWAERLPLETVYLGGGTPSLLGSGAVGRMVDAISARVSLDSLTEFTAEANPESFTPELAADWRAAGVDRVSLGAQTFHAPSLRWMGRRHGPDGPARAVATARNAGFENLGLDLIFGLPERLGRDLDDDLDRLVALAPDHVSVYGLSVEPETPLGRWVAEGREVVPEDGRYREEYLRVAERLTTAGYDHYEVSNFARPGSESRHNAAYWRGVSYLGLGSGAHSFVAPERWWNHRDWRAYREAVMAGRGGRAGHEKVEPESARLEAIWLGLRTREGLPRASLSAAQSRVVEEWQERGWVLPDAESVRLSLEGWLLLDRLTVELDEAA
ncbi:MAG: radical SAM family heme chaperone HemW [Gemmatimonadota bacterium]